ncbi:helix-turn-helix domain-containing protein [Arenibacter certesii]|uniref:HTH araC/xylS-type domain-containing protein n=1 Tax=Arenibacter certesii TaxID=228955 RepID=A0A918IUD7_9FLAO|nr:helix-turn-helix transcriptional regulator [Arenibacter certesii]GGW28962.1 hypothetical protein GCM10007383_12960 [Arenibacter certesii]
MLSFYKSLLLITALLFAEVVVAKQTQKNSFDTFFDIQNSLLLNRDHLKNAFPLSNEGETLVYETSASTKGNSYFPTKKEEIITLLKSSEDITEVTREHKMLELENKAQNEKINLIVVVLILLFLISCLAIYSYLKVRQKNNILVNRTIELAEIQLKIQKELAGFLKTERNGSDTNLNKIQNAIDKDVKEIIMFKLNKLEKGIFFLDPNCNLHLLSEQLKTNPKYLSQVINQEKKTNFNNYINELRINYLLPKLLTDPDYRNSKLSYIAVSLGYNNLNTFNSAFKKRMGILPSKFINELNHSRQLNNQNLT